jgi:fucose 4-O-acetylase-like acetyltransferase
MLVVLHHSIQWSDGAGHGSPIWLSVTEALSTMRLPLFFMVSGLLAARWMTAPWRSLLRVKVANLFWLFLLWQAFTFLAYLAVPNVSTPGKSHVAELLTAAATPLRPQNSLWFIWALALFFMLSRLIFGKMPGWAVIAAAALPATLSFAGVVQFGNVGWDGAANNYVFFAVGVFGVQHVKRLGEVITRTAAAGIVAAWIAFVALVPAFEAVGLNLVSRGLGLLAGIGLGILLQKSGYLMRAGRSTLTYYLPHFIFLGILAFLASVLPVPDSASWWLPLVMFAVTIRLCIDLRALAGKVSFGRWAYEMPPGIIPSEAHKSH